MAPLTVSILARIEPSEKNRAFCLVWYLYPDFPNTSCQTLEGLAAPKSFHFYRVLREAGEWTILSVVRRTDGDRRAQATVIVGGGYGAGPN